MAYFTVWIIILTAIYLAVSMKAASPRASCSTLALHHLLFSLALVGNFIVVVVYWSLIHKKFVTSEYAKANPKLKDMTYTMHTVPAISILYVFCKQDVILRAKDSVLLLPLGLVFTYSNYLGTMKQGSPIYWFLTWEDWRSGLICFAITGFGVALYLVLSWLTV